MSFKFIIKIKNKKGHIFQSEPYIAKINMKWPGFPFEHYFFNFCVYLKRGMKNSAANFFSKDSVAEYTKMRNLGKMIPKSGIFIFCSNYDVK